MKTEQATKLRLMLQAMFPNPKSVADPLDPHGTLNGYCIGGAICIYVEKNPQEEINFLVLQEISGQFKFPLGSTLVKAMRKLNNQLDDDMGYHYASKIMVNNDCKSFDAAWEAFERAMQYGEPECQNQS